MSLPRRHRTNAHQGSISQASSAVPTRCRSLMAPPTSACGADTTASTSTTDEASVRGGRPLRAGQGVLVPYDPSRTRTRTLSAGAGALEDDYSDDEYDESLIPGMWKAEQYKTYLTTKPNPCTDANLLQLSSKLYSLPLAERKALSRAHAGLYDLAADHLVREAVSMQGPGGSMMEKFRSWLPNRVDGSGAVSVDLMDDADKCLLVEKLDLGSRVSSDMSKGVAKLSSDEEHLLERMRELQSAEMDTLESLHDLHAKTASG